MQVHEGHCLCKLLHRDHVETIGQHKPNTSGTSGTLPINTDTKVNLGYIFWGVHKVQPFTLAGSENP